MNWQAWFSAGEHVIGLPSWRRPRVLMPSRDVRQRWRDSRWYPAVRPTARTARKALQAAVASGILPTRQVSEAGWPLGEWVQNSLSDVPVYAVVRHGTPSHVQKTVACLIGAGGQPIGFVKYAQLPAARALLRREAHILRDLPPGLGPAVLNEGAFDEGEALLLEAIPGGAVPASLEPDQAVDMLLARMVIGEPVPLNRHPGAARLREVDPQRVEPWLAALGDRVWPVVVQHGDLTPWNLLRQPDGTVRAVDWEYAQNPGLPCIDWCHHVLQGALLIRRWPPARARAFAQQRLIHRFGNLNAAAARAIVSLTAFEGYLMRRSEGFADHDATQVWRREVGDWR